MSTARRVVIILLIVSLSVGAMTGGLIFYRLSYMWGLILFGGWVWFTLARRGLGLRRSANTLRAHVGQVFEERFDIQNLSRVPFFWVAVRDVSSLPGSQSSRVLSLVRAQKGRSYLVRTRLVQRGVYNLGPTVLSSGDIFGLFRITYEVPPQEALLVYPPIFDIQNFPNPPGLLPGGESLRRRTHQVTPNAAGVREYVPGDSLNRIHWVSTARRDRLMVKEFELDPLADVWLFIDSERDVQASLPTPAASDRAANFWNWFPTIDLTFAPKHPIHTNIDSFRDASEEKLLSPSTEEYSVSIGASLARYFLKTDRAVGLVSMAQSLTLLPPDRSGRQLGKIVEALALLKADGDIPLRGWVETQAHHLSRGSTVVLITPSIQDDAAFVLDRLMQMGLRPVAILLDAASFGGPSGTSDVIAKIETLGVPTYRITNGCDLNAVLSIGAMPKLGIPYIVAHRANAKFS